MMPIRRRENGKKFADKKAGRLGGPQSGYKENHRQIPVPVTAIIGRCTSAR